MSQLLDKTEQLKLLPSRMPILQIAERPIQSKTSLNVSIPKSSIIPERLGHHDKVIPVCDYTITLTLSEHDSISRTIRKGMKDIRRETLAYDDPIHRPLPNQLKYLYM